MNREQKVVEVQALKDDFSASKASFLIGYKGLTVNQMQRLRRELKEKGGKLRVAKARLMRRAVENMEDRERLAPFFKDQIGLVFASDEVPSVAKVLYQFSKDNEALQLVIGVFEDHMLDSAGISRIATLPSRDVLLAQLCGTLKAPTTGLANVLNMLILRLLWTLNQIGEKKQ